MIPSDHFTRFYNEVFKFLESQGEEDLRAYWLTISAHQELHCLELFKTKGLQGMKDYWDKIAVEENCDLTCEVHEDYFESRMNRCPSLTKAMDNDAGLMPRYCDHCPGWAVPLLEKAGFFPVFDVKSRTEPTCEFRIYKTKEAMLRHEACHNP